MGETLVAYLLQRKGKTVEELLAVPTDEGAVRQALFADGGL